MRPRTTKSRAFKGSMVVLALAATLIVAVALPRATVTIDAKPTEFEVAAKGAAEVKRLEVKVGDQVQPGAALLVLIDPAVEAEILQLENELKLLQLGTKQAVVEEGITGMIGSLPRVVWTNTGSLATPPKSKPVDTSAIDGAVKQLDRQSQSVVVQIKELSADVESVEAAILEGNVTVVNAETDAKNAEQALDVAQKEWDKLQRLYDMGAIPKKKLDASVEAFQAASADVATKKSAVSEVSKNVRDLESRLADLKDRLAKANKEITGLSAKLASEKTKAVELRKQKDETPSFMSPSRPVKKIVYGTAPETMAPLQVDLVDVEDPDKEAKILALQAKIAELRKKRDALRITAPVGGYVKSIVEPGTKVANLDTLVVIGFAR